MTSQVYSMGHLGQAEPEEAERFRTEAFAGGRFEVRSSRGVRSVERILLEHVERADRGRVLVLRSREGLLAAAVRRLFPEARVAAWDFDVHDQGAAIASLEGNGVDLVEWNIAPLPLAGESDLFDRALLPLPGDQEVELSREMIHHAHRLLRVGGLLLAAMETKKSGPLETQLRKCFSSLHHEEARRGRVWFARKKPSDRPPGPPGFASYTVREGERVLAFASQAGVFAHGRLDEGTRALLKVLEVRPEDAILDLGCGAGELGIVAAIRAPAGRAVLVDSNTRAIQAAERNAEALIPGRWRTVTTADPARDLDDSFDLALANPPYFGHHRVSEVFLEAARERLRPGGRLYLVTKQASWHREAIPEFLRLDDETALLGYTVFRATRAPPGAGVARHPTSPSSSNVT